MFEQHQINQRNDNKKSLKVTKSCSDLMHKDFDYPYLNRKDLILYQQ